MPGEQVLIQLTESKSKFFSSQVDQDSDGQ
ncbi:hypothetical protein QW180_12820 [Vibrio sinaloensis]|nr:hypothetical protein [Vibrio sinaloensis]